MTKILNRAAVLGLLFFLWSCNFMQASTVSSIALNTGVFDPAINSVASGVRNVGASTDTSDRPTTENGRRIYAANRGNVKAQNEILSATKNNVEQQWKKDAEWHEGGSASASQQAKNTDDHSSNVEDRLKKLKKLEDAGLITSDEAKSKRKEILKDM